MKTVISSLGFTAAILASSAVPAGAAKHAKMAPMATDAMAKEVNFYSYPLPKEACVFTRHLVVFQKPQWLDHHRNFYRYPTNNYGVFSCLAGIVFDS